jgi:2-C-methyl-D-erythritol 4-phosphate cytidylyltransferase
MKVSAIIPAAGQGTRMSAGVPKQFLLLNGRPILEHTIGAFQNSGLIDSIVLAVPEQDFELQRQRWLNDTGITVIVGGEKRQDSVYNGFKALPQETEIVLVHDGVRPFVTKEIIGRTIEGARNHGAAITAIPVNDTIKRVDVDGRVDRTVDREGLWRVQTPQGFGYELLGQAFEMANADSFYGTDEASLIEHLGKTVIVVPGSELNIKITRQEDLILSEGILRSESNRID